MRVRLCVGPLAALALAASTLAGFSVLGCTGAAQIRGELSGLEQVVDQAERNGAIRCAPRELALARSNIEFAQVELDQGFISKAKHHLWLAKPNAKAALDLSPAQYCTERQFVEAGDRDGDSYLDPDDGCPDNPENFNGFEDEDGCPDHPDTDGDGITDDRDTCLLEPEDKDGYLETDGCPELDNDLDSLPDAQDQCPNDPEDPDGFQDEDGCPDLDNDQDEVPDITDQCPNEIGSKTKEPIGCPEKPALAMITDCEVRITQQIFFEFNRDAIRPISFPVLDAVADVLLKNPKIKIEVQGHTDNVGSASYNHDLSNRRAQAVKMYLAAHGVEPGRLTSQGYGFDRPLVPNDSADNRALNRRVQFIRTEGQRQGCENPAP
ncbi:MAG TPA: OmpA family protein [Polyangiaceae bacterium]|jgi:outer membrane protein OmpA-like peptidoglycan-associated protein|nr:OmpA family protein [Polyangiaceae bacterium]